MASPVANATLNIARLGNVQNGTTNMAKFDIMSANITLFKVIDEF